MQTIKQPRYPYFDFSETPLDVNALRARFAANFDAVTLCKFSAAGLGHFNNRHKYEQQRLERYFYNSGDEHKPVWQWAPRPSFETDVRPAACVGDKMLFARLHAQTVKLDAQIFGPHPHGTVVQVVTVDDTVPAGRTQHHPGLLHIDGTLLTLRQNRMQATYDYIDDSPLPTRYIRDFRNDGTDPLAATIRAIAVLAERGRSDLFKRQGQDEHYREALRAAEPRFWTALPNTIVLRATLTPHIAQVAQVPTRRAHAHLVVARPV